MALEFTTIPDRTGPAIYIIGNGTIDMEKQLKLLGEEVDKLTEDETQVVYLDPNTREGQDIKTFYAIETLPIILIVMDDDTVPYQWSGTLPRPDEISYALSQING